MTEFRFDAGQCDVAVVGAGHAGIEGALAAARMGVSTVLFTLNLDAVGNMPCNPAIGGTGKGHLVYEIDAMGGEMGRASDAVCLQSRMLNSSRGAAVHSLRQQADRVQYRAYMKSALERQENLSLVQAEIAALERDGDGFCLVTRFGAVWRAKSVILCAGTYLCANIVVGDVNIQSGPDNLAGADLLTQSLKDLGLEIRRFKTGTPPRIHADSIDYEKCEIQIGDEEPFCFSSDTDVPAFSARAQQHCHIVYTNEKTHQIIRDNIHRSPLYSGRIKSVGPRYCPSIEDKIMHFPDKERHQLFLEPMGFDTKEVYVQGLSSSLPEDVQLQVLHSIEGLERARVMRTAYAIEYDCVDPQQLTHTLEFREIKNLYGAGQFNGTSGYEEAACQGLVAGINAAAKLRGLPPLVLPRDSSYTGILIDDLVTKGTNEPYRMMTSRCEHRLILRQDNADRRMFEYACRYGLISEERIAQKKALFEALDAEIARVQKTYLSPSKELNDLLVSRGATTVDTGACVADLMRRPQLDYDLLAPVDTARPALSREICRRVQIEIKYEGYVRRAVAQNAAQKKLYDRPLPQDLDYTAIRGLRLEAAAKLQKLRPQTIGDAARISGVSPADVTVLLVYLNLL